MCVSVNEGMKAVCFGWGTAGGREGTEGAETVRESADRGGRAAGRNRDESTVSLCVKSIQIHPPTAIASAGQLRIFIGRRWTVAHR